MKSPGMADSTWRLPVLMYHSVTRDYAETASPHAVTRRRLEEQLTSLTAAGWALVGLTEALTILHQDPGRPVAALTFDDGLLDFLNAFDVLNQIGARATLYVPTSLVGKHVVSPDSGASTLAWSELRELASLGIEIGSHSCRHHPLDIHNARTVTAEVVDSKHELEHRLGIDVVSFCYPHGYASAQVLSAVADAGYANACIIGRRIARPVDDTFAIPRLEVRPTVTAHSIHELVCNGEPGIAPIVKRAATPAWRMVRRISFNLLHRELT